MKDNRIIFRIGILILCIVTVITGILVSGFSMKQPVFLKNIIIKTVPSQADDETAVYFSLKYLAPEGFKKQVQSISFLSENEEATAYASESPISFSGGFTYFGANQTNYQTIGHYQLHTVYIQMNPKLNDGQKLLGTNAIILFNDGSSQKVDLGTIMVQEENYDDGNLFTNGDGSRSSTTWSKANTISEDITVLGIDFHGIDKYMNYPFVLINDKKLTLRESESMELFLKAGERFRVTMEDTTLSERITYNFPITIKIKQGEEIRKYDFDFFENNYNFFENQWQIKEYLKRRRKET